MPGAGFSEVLVEDEYPSTMSWDNRHCPREGHTFCLEPKYIFTWEFLKQANGGKWFARKQNHFIGIFAGSLSLGEEERLLQLHHMHQWVICALPR